MATSTYQIQSKKSKSEISALLNDITNEKGGLGKVMTGKKFVGGHLAYPSNYVY